MRRATTVLVAIVLSLISVGVVMLASTSSVRGAAHYGDPYYFLKRQMAWLGLGLVASAIALRLDVQFWRRPWVATTLAVGTGVLLILVLIPHVGPRIGGSRRWIRVAGLSFQPSELAKFVLVTTLSARLTAVARRIRTLRYGFLEPVGALGVLCGLLLLEPDFGTTVLCAMVGWAILFVAGTPLRYLVPGALLGALGLAAVVVQDPVRLTRWLAFLNPDAHPEVAYHLRQSMIAFMRGGWRGVGIGNSIQKQFYLPEAHTDFILAIIGEELGFGATLTIAFLFLGLLICGMIISLQTPHLYGKLTAFGLTLMLVTQAVMNVGVVTGCLPTKGLPLPFISYGGSSLLVSMVMAAVLVRVGRSAENAARDRAEQPMHDRLHRL